MKPLIRKLYVFGDRLKEWQVRVKTVLWYNALWGAMGKKCMVFKPIRLVNPRNIHMGSGVRIYKNSRIETIEVWEGTRFKPRVTIGDGTSIEQSLHLVCASSIEIGHDVVISADVMITDNGHGYDEINKSVMRQPLIVKNTVIGDYCFIGMGARIMPGSKLGKNCIVGANSVVTGEFPDYSVLAGVPAKIIKSFDIETGKWETINR